MFKVVWGVVLVLVLVVGGGLIYLTSSFPNVGPAIDVQIEATPERVERGRYLADHVAVCIDCHSARNWDYYSGPIVAGTEGQGGERFGEEMGFPGTLYAQNITPAGIGTWTDGEVVRLITSGVTKDGKAIFPLMPYPSYGQMSQEDVYSIVAYLRTLPPVEHTPQKSSLNFPMNLIVRTIPQPYTPQVRPEPADTLAYGAYMTTISGCAECHTQAVKGEPVPGMAFAGGFVFPMPQNRTVVSSNITPDAETGIGTWTKAQFVERFKRFTAPAMQTMGVDQGGENTIMPWTMYAGMTEEDLGAIYAYLRTVDPVNHKVETYPNQ